MDFFITQNLFLLWDFFRRQFCSRLAFFRSPGTAATGMSWIFMLFGGLMRFLIFRFLRLRALRDGILRAFRAVRILRLLPLRNPSVCHKIRHISFRFHVRTVIVRHPAVRNLNFLNCDPFRQIIHHHSVQEFSVLVIELRSAVLTVGT